jgi:hypothetical protein
LDFGDELRWPFSKNELFDFMKSDEIVIAT